MARKGDEYKIDEAPAASKVFTQEQMQAFLDEVKRTDKYHGLYAYYALMIDYGWRRGEGLGLRRKDVDFDAKTITIAQQVTRNPVTNKTAITTPKSEAGKRVLPASDEALALIRLQVLRAGAQRPGDLLFPGEDGKERQPNGITQHMRRVCKRLGFVGYTLHSLRKYAITDWRADGVDLEVAAAMAGHKGVKVTAETYSIPTLERKREAVNRKKKAE
jgi:integrase